MAKTMLTAAHRGPDSGIGAGSTPLMRARADEDIRLNEERS
jgi:hypothetical protein